MPDTPTFTLTPIAWVRSGYTERAQVPKGPSAAHSMEGAIEVREDLEAGLQDIEGFSHVYVLWVFDRADPGYDLLTTPPNDDRAHGLFATRTPRRPNPIALTVVEVLGREGRRLLVRGLDMLDGTPVVDIKPYLSNVPAEALKRGWLADAEARKARSSTTGF